MAQFDAELDLAGLTGANGYKLYGPSDDDLSECVGARVSSAGDINGDGSVDLIVSAHFADKAYVVFGGSSNLAALDALDTVADGIIHFTALDGSNGFAIDTGDLASDLF